MMDEKFFAWLDGELDPAEAIEMEKRVAADPELARAAEEHRALGARLQSAFAPVAQAPVPEHLSQAIRPAATVTDLSNWRERKQVRRSGLPQWTAMAASLAVGLFAGSMVNRPAADGPVELRGGQLIAASVVGKALDTQLASAAQGDVRVGLTFRDQQGRICRTFSGASGSGLACHAGDGWQVKGLFAAPEGSTGDYRMAAGEDPQLGALVDSTIAGEPFDAQAEAQAKAKGWK